MTNVTPQSSPHRPSGDANESPASLESVLCTQELDRRPSRPADYEQESRTLVSLAQAMADSPGTILHVLAETIQRVLRCGSAGISLASEDGARFYWPAISGAWRPYQGEGTPRALCACGDVLDRGGPLLFRRFERRYTSLQLLTPPAEECLMAPFSFEGRCVGTVWGMIHQAPSGVDRAGGREFDAEDLRMLVSLSRFATVAYQAVKQLRGLQASPGENRDGESGLCQMNEALLISSVRQHELAAQATEAEAAARKSEDRYRTLFASIDEGMCVIEMLFDDAGAAVDYRFLEVNPAFEAQSGLHEVVGKRMRELAPAHEAHWYEAFGRVALTGESVRFADEARDLGRWFDVYAFRHGGPESRRVAVLFTDITARRRSEALISSQNERLQLLWESAGVLLAEDEPEAMLRGLFEMIGPQLGVDAYLNYLVDETGVGLRRASYGGIPEGAGATIEEIEFGAGISGTVAQKRRSMHATHIQQSDDPRTQVARSLGFRAYLCNPLLSDEVLLGTLAFGSRSKDEFSPEELTILQTISRYVSVAYARLRVRATLRESESRYRRLFQSAKDGILILDAHSGEISAANGFMAGLVGRDASELMGKQLFEIGMFTDVEENKEAFRELQRAKYLRYDHLPVRNKAGDRVEVEFVANVYQDGDRLVAQCNVRDIGERSRLEKQVAQQSEALAMQSTRKDEFLAMLSHELRNPLAPIRAAVHLLRMEEGDGGNPVRQQAREIIERQVANLTKMVSDLSEVSRVVSGRIRLDLQPVNLKQIIQHSLQSVAPLFEQRRHSVSVMLCPEAVWARVDPSRLEEVLVNLLNNAAKYTPDGGRVEVVCEHRVEGERRFALIRVRDNGVGIDRELLPRIFDLFTQADRSLARSAGGLGIGLSLAHRLVEMHGGTISAESRGPGEGSVFMVKLPLIPAPAIPEPEAGGCFGVAAHSAPAGRGGEPVRVLVVDDNVDLVTMLSYALRQKGYTVRSAFTGLDGLRVAQEWQPNIAILDIGLPGLDGYEIARRLRAGPAPGEKAGSGGNGDAAGRMRLIALTGYGQDTDIALAVEAGFDGHMVKPCDVDELEKMMVESSPPR